MNTMIREKACTHCRQKKSLDEFYSARKARDGRQSWCKECVKRAAHEHGRKHPERRSKQQAGYRLKRRYGISTEQYNEMFERQNGACAICGKPCSTGRRLAVDHDHETGRVRGLLCSHCNTILARAGDNIKTLEACIEYLRAEAA